MSLEKSNLPFERELYDKNLKSVAKYSNKKRSLKEKILGDNKITHIDLAHEKAIGDNRKVEQEKKSKEMDENLEIIRKREYKKKEIIIDLFIEDYIKGKLSMNLLKHFIFDESYSYGNYSRLPINKERIENALAAGEEPKFKVVFDRNEKEGWYVKKDGVKIDIVAPEINTQEIEIEKKTLLKRLEEIDLMLGVWNSPYPYISSDTDVSSHITNDKKLEKKLPK